MVDSGCFKTKLKGEKQRSDEGKTENRRRKKIWTTYIVHI